MDGFEVKRVAQHEGDVVRDAEIGHPIPGKHALDTDHEAVAKRLEGTQQGLRPGRQSPVKNDIAGVINHADVHGPGVQVDAAVESMLALVESHSWSPSKWTVRWCGNLKHTHGTETMMSIRAPGDAGQVRACLAADTHRPLKLLSFGAPANSGSTSPVQSRRAGPSFSPSSRSRVRCRRTPPQGSCSRASCYGRALVLLSSNLVPQQPQFAPQKIVEARALRRSW